MSKRPFQGFVNLPRARCCTIRVGAFYYAFLVTRISYVRVGKRSERYDLTLFLNYREKHRPSMDVFERREWMRLYFGQWNGGKFDHWVEYDEEFEKEHVELVGESDHKPDDPSETPGGIVWPGVVKRLEIVSSLPSIDSRDEPSK